MQSSSCYFPQLSSSLSSLSMLLSGYLLYRSKTGTFGYTLNLTLSSAIVCYSVLKGCFYYYAWGDGSAVGCNLLLLTNWFRLFVAPDWFWEVLLVCCWFETKLCPVYTLKRPYVLSRTFTIELLPRLLCLAALETSICSSASESSSQSDSSPLCFLWWLS